MAGFSLVELMIAMTITLILMAAASMLLSNSMRVRRRENQRTDALADAQRAVNIMSRDIANSGFGVDTNQIVIADSNATQIRIRANVTNTNGATSDEDEDVMYVFQSGSSAIVRYDSNSNPATVSLASRINNLQFTYFNYVVNQMTGAVNVTQTITPTTDTARVRIAVTVTLDAIGDQPASQVQLTSDVALRNAPYSLYRY